MGVIFKDGDDTNDLLVPYIQRKDGDISAERINELYLKASLGKISSFEFWDGLGLGKEYPGIEKDYLDNYLKLDLEFKRTAENLKTRFKLGILSNDVKEWSEYLRKKYNLDRLFELVVISGNVGFRKPCKDIFEILLIRSKAKPNDCIFIDDREKNLETAKNLGIYAIKFVRDIESKRTSEFSEVSSFNQLKELLG